MHGHPSNIPMQGMGGQQAPNFGQTFQVPPQMLDYGIGVGTKMISEQREKLMPGVAGLWSSLKIYFAVNNTFVTKRLVTLMYPYANKNYYRTPADEVHSDSHKWALPKDDLNAPDLYVPLMSFVTYILLFGLVKGIYDSSFTPDVLIQAIWGCCMLQVVEVLMIKFGLGMMQASLPMLELFAYTGYKYVGLCVITILKLLGTSVKFLASLYFAFMLASYFLKCIRSLIPQNENGPVPRHVLLLIFSGLEFVLTLGLGIFS